MTDPVEDTSYLRTLLQLGQTLNASLDLDYVMNLAMEQVVQFVQAERGFILLVEEGTNRVWGRVTHGLDAKTLETALNARDREEVPEISRTIVEQAMRERHAVLSTNAMEDPRFSARSSVRLAQVRSVLCVPLVAQGRLLGVIYLDNRVRTAVFNERDTAMVTAFAHQATVAIENARLYANLRKSMEERLRLTEEVHTKETERRALEEANQLKSDFMGYVSHELRNPLTAIRGYVQTLLADEENNLGPEIRFEFYETIEAECERMLGLIYELLDSARLEAGRPLTLNRRAVQLGPLIERLARAQRYFRFWTPRHRIRVDISPSLPLLEADEEKIHQILSNLLNNAVKYSPDGGIVSVQAQMIGEGVEIRVQDEGVGISPEQQEMLFGRYERLEREDIRDIPGTGLGLFLTRHLVELHGGRITCDSRLGGGSTFTVYLPARPDSENGVS